MRTTPLYNLAFQFLQQHEGEHLAHDRQRLVARCVDHLVSSAVASHDTARDVTLQACAELACRRRMEYIDCDRTTSYALFLVDAEGKKQFFTVPELISLIDQARHRNTP